MIVDAALSKEGDILENIVVLDDMVKVGVTFTTNVLKWLDFEAWLGRMFRAAFRIDFGIFEDGLEPGKVLVVVGYHNFKLFRVPGDG